ncbi:MAG: site-2 protease family protein [Candidatus Diapherotrites archaeon]|nr:site-2 protease family protein [Candidatus Diapherotrites archaeon]
MKTQEKFDLIVSWITLSIAFAIVIGLFPFGLEEIFITLPIAFLAVGTGFVFHELAHRQAARKFGFHSEYRAWYGMLVVALIFSLITRMVIAAPGATYFFGKNVSRRQNGIISVAGPITNIFIGFIFLLLMIALVKSNIYTSEISVVPAILYYVSQINFFFAFFNMLPILIFDGAKVFVWNKKIWFAVFGIAALMSFLPDIILGVFGIALGM